MPLQYIATFLFPFIEQRDVLSLSLTCKDIFSGPETVMSKNAVLRCRIERHVPLNLWGGNTASFFVGTLHFLNPNLHEFHSTMMRFPNVRDLTLSFSPLMVTLSSNPLVDLRQFRLRRLCIHDVSGKFLQYITHPPRDLHVLELHTKSSTVTITTNLHSKTILQVF